MAPIWKYRPYILLFVVVQAVVLFLYVRFYRQSDLTATSQFSKRWLRVNIRGRDVLCVPTEDDVGALDTFTLLCGDDERSVSGSLNNAGVLVNSSQSTFIENITVIPDPPDLDTVLAGFPNEYLSITDSSKKMDFRCDVCALVSTSGHLTGTGAGKEIDNATCVVRMNASPVKGYEDDVGSRTTLRMVSFIVMNSKGLTQRDILDNNRPETVVLWPTLKKDVYPNVIKSYSDLSKNYTNIDFYYASNKQVEFLDNLFGKETGKTRLVSGSWLSTGWFTMTLMLYSCQSIRIYGMVESDYCDNPSRSVDVPYHYYEPNGVTECKFYKSMETRRNGGHRFITEKYVFRKWAESANVTFHYPTWNITHPLGDKPFFMKSPNNLFGKKTAKKRR